MSARRIGPVTIRGVTYASSKAAAAALNVTPGAVYLAHRKGRLDKVGLGADARRVHCDLTIRGVTYPDVEAAAAALGVTEGNVRRAARRGTLEHLGLGRRGATMPVRIHGIDYPSAVAAAQALKVTESAIAQAIAAGDPDRIGRRRAPKSGVWAKSKPVVLHGVAYPSRSALARAVGLSVSHVCKVLSAGTERQRRRLAERALAAAMHSAGAGAWRSAA